MKTKTVVSLTWQARVGEGPNVYQTNIGNFSAIVNGKKYYIYKMGSIFEKSFDTVFQAKSRSVKDSFDRAGKKLMKLIIQDSK